MFNWFYGRIANLYDKKINASGLAVFRILYSIVLLCEVIQIYYFRHLIFDKIPFIEPSDVDFSIALIVWLICIVFLMLGLFTKSAALVNYILSLVFIATIHSYEYHMFYVYMGVNFLLMFVNVSQSCSLDNLWLRIKYSNTRFLYSPPRTVSVLNYYVIVIVAIAFVYFDSVFYKLSSHNWMTGLGLWLPASLPQVVHTNTSPLLNCKWLVVGLGYLTLVFETIFIFVFWRKKWRWLLFAVGIGLHIGIVIQFPIPWFGLGVCALYVLMIPVGFWDRCRNLLKLKQKIVTFYYDEECPVCNRTRIILSFFDVLDAVDFKGLQTHGINNPALQKYTKDELLSNIFAVTSKGKILQGIDTYSYVFKRIPFFIPIGYILSVPGFHHIGKRLYNLIAENRHVERCTEDTCGYTPGNVPGNKETFRMFKNFTVRELKIASFAFGIVILSVLQLNVTYNSDVFKIGKSLIGLSNSKPENLIQKISKPVRQYSKIFLGITKHEVFMDMHFWGYNHIVAVEAEDEHGRKYWLPIIQRNGMADYYIYSFNWVKWTFRVNSQNIDQDRFVKGVRDFTTFWAVQNGHPLRKMKFNIYVKPVQAPLNWEKDYLNKMLQKEWTFIGDMRWNESDFVSNVPVIENIKP
jgi:predicted DCC family thiol-disulfide oxidoreductase YuxK/uncharacterized membrane protein YphA (DoxX/SURF4 family)